MKRTWVTLALGFVLIHTSTAFAVDLTRIDRTIRKEPKYKSKTPRYALLVFGDKAQTRAWLVLDGDVVYVDRNGNGDLTDADERVPLDVEATNKINVRGGAYKGMNVFALGTVAGVRLRFQHWVRNEEFVAKDDFYKQVLKQRKDNQWESGTLWRMTIDGRQAQNPVTLCPKPKDAQISHLAGPLTFELKWGKRQSLKDGLFDVHIGTPGHPTRNSMHSVFSPLTTTEVPKDLHPIARFEFANADPDKAPIVQKVALDQRC